MKPLSLEKTARGFGLVKFKDNADTECKLQISSIIADEPSVWFGPRTIKLEGYVIDNGWHEYTADELKKKLGVTDLVSNSPMLLTQSQVKALLPHLQKFAETGNF